VAGTVTLWLGRRLCSQSQKAGSRESSSLPLASLSHPRYRPDFSPRLFVLWISALSNSKPTHRPERNVVVRFGRLTFSSRFLQTMFHPKTSTRYVILPKHHIPLVQMPNGCSTAFRFFPALPPTPSRVSVAPEQTDSSSVRSSGPRHDCFYSRLCLAPVEDTENQKDEGERVSLATSPSRLETPLASFSIFNRA
jgi:hypothetical protein